MAESSDYKRALQRIAEALEETAFDSTDEEVLEEVRAAGLEPEEEADRIKAMMLETVKAYKRQLRERLKREHDKRATAFQQKEFELPETPSERRSLLDSMLAAQPGLEARLTVQFREGTSMPDEDVISALRQLRELGLDEEDTEE